jgi:hypothetical protein
MWISEAGTIHRWFSGTYLMRSSGRILLSLLPTSGWLNRSLISCLLFCAVRFLWFFAYVSGESIEGYNIALLDFMLSLEYFSQISITCSIKMGETVVISLWAIVSQTSWDNVTYFKIYGNIGYFLLLQDRLTLWTINAEFCWLSILESGQFQDEEVVARQDER